MELINWNSTLELDQENVDLSFLIFFDKINNLTDKHAPLRKLTQIQMKTLTKPWMEGKDRAERGRSSSSK